MRARTPDAAHSHQQPSTLADSPTAPPFSEPELQQEAHGFRNPRIAGDPATQGAGIDPQALGGLHLVQVQPSKDLAELLRRHGHSIAPNLPATVSQGKLPQVASVPALSVGAICPTFSSRWPVIRWKRHGDTFGEPSACSRSLRTNCASWAPARCRVTTTFARSRWRGAGCGSPWPRSGRPPMRFAPGLGAWAWLGNVRRRVASCPDLLPWSRAPFRSSCGRSGGPREWSCDWSIRYARSGPKLTAGTEPRADGAVCSQERYAAQ